MPEDSSDPVCDALERLGIPMFEAPTPDQLANQQAMQDAFAEADRTGEPVEFVFTNGRRFIAEPSWKHFPEPQGHA